MFSDSKQEEICILHYFHFPVHVCRLGYVDNIKDRLVCMTKEEREKIQEKYKDKVPEPLISQFLEKTPKNEAIKCYKERKAKTAELFPTGECKTKIEYIISAICSSRCNFLTCMFFIIFSFRTNSTDPGRKTKVDS